MAKKASEQIADINRRYQKNLDGYIKSKEFELVAEKALIDFIKRVKRGLMPDLSKIPELSESYEELRARHKKNLGNLAKATKSNATATGQMLDAMISETTKSGFALIIQATERSKELNGSSPRLNNAEVAGYYALHRYIFDFSEPELKRIIRNIKADLLAIIRKSK